MTQLEKVFFTIAFVKRFRVSSEMVDGGGTTIFDVQLGEAFSLGPSVNEKFDHPPLTSKTLSTDQAYRGSSPSATHRTDCRWRTRAHHEESHGGDNDSHNSIEDEPASSTSRKTGQVGQRQLTTISTLVDRVSHRGCFV